MSKKCLTAALAALLLLSDVSFAAGPLWWLRPRNWRRSRVTYSQPVVAASQPSIPPASDPGQIAGVEAIQRLHELDSSYRETNGVDPCKLHSKLCEVAQDHAEYMARTGYFDHFLRGAPWDRAYEAGWPNSAAENISRGHPNFEAAYNGWFWSGSHRVNMLQPYWVWCGFGVAYSDSGMMYAVAMYSQ